MPNVLGDIKFTVTVANETTDFVSLRSLLMVQEEQAAAPVVSYATSSEEATDQGPTVRTRKASRRAARSRTAPQNFTSPNSQAQTRSILQAAVDRVQALNAQVLSTADLNFGVAPQSAQNSNIPIEPPPLTFPTVGEGVIIPSVIALASYTPIVDEQGQLNSCHKSLVFKRAARRLSVDMQVINRPITMSTRQGVPRLKIADSLKDYLNKRDTFIRSLGDRFESVEEKLNLTFSTTDPPSNTEYLATIIRDYANAAVYATGDYQDCPERFASSRDNNGTNQLARSVEQVSPSYKDAYDTFGSFFTGDGARITSRNFLFFRNRVRSMSMDKRVRTVASIIGKETVTSYNISKQPKFFTNPQRPSSTANPVEQSSALPGGNAAIMAASVMPNINLVSSANAAMLTNSGPLANVRGALNPITADRNTFYPNFIFNAEPTARSIKIAAAGDPESFFVSTIFRRQETRRDNNVTRTVVSYPFETTKSRGRSQKTSFEFVKELINPYLPSARQITIAYGDSKGGVFDSPYRAFASSANAACELMKEVYEMNRDEGTAFETPFVNAAVLVARSFKTSYENNLDFLLELAMLDMASTDIQFARRLLIYLAFRQEVELKYDGVGGAPAGPSALLRADGYLKDDPILNEDGSGVVSKTSTIFPSNVKIDPPLGGSVAETMAPAETTTLTVEQNAGSGNSGTLESLFGISFSEVARQTAMMFRRVLTDEYTELTAAESSGIRQKIVFPTMVQLLQHTREGTIFSRLSQYPSYYLPGHDASNRSYDLIGNSHFSAMKKTMIFAGFFDLVCVLSEYTFNRLYQKRSAGGLDFSVPAVVGPSGPVTKAPSYQRKANFANRQGILQRFASAGVSSILGVGNAPDEDFTRNFDIIARTIGALRAEQEFILGFPDLFRARNEKVAEDFEALKESLAVEVPGIDGDLPLGRYIANGLVPSLDTARYLSQYHLKLNGTSMFYNDTKTNDPILSDQAFNFMNGVLAPPSTAGVDWQKNKNTKVMVVGIPSGLLEDLENITPVTNALDGQTTTIKPMFDVVITKYDETNPFVAYTPLRVTFSRQLFFRQPDINGRPEFVSVDKDLQVAVLGADEVDTFLDSFSQPEQRALAAGVLANHYDDWALKTYFDLQDDLDFQESAFPNNTSRLQDVYSTKIEVPNLEYVDTDKAMFLSASNAQFSPTPISLATSNFYDPNKQCIDLQDKSSTNPYEYSLFDYVNTYGTLFDRDLEQNKVSSGMIFEKVLCIPFTDEDFTMGMDEEMLELAGQAAGAASPGGYTAPSLCTYSVRISMQGDQLDLLNREAT